MKHLFKNSITVLFVILIAIIFSSGCGKKKEQTNLKVSGYYDVKDHFNMMIAGTPMDGDLSYVMYILPKGEEDTVLIYNINKSFDKVVGVVKADSIIIPQQTILSKSGGKYDILPYGGKKDGNSLYLMFEYDDRTYDNLTGLVVCDLTGDLTEPYKKEENK
ncbi:MAG: hypothetical protein ABI543_03555 [Ignavibacteria bacterium]